MPNKSDKPQNTSDVPRKTARQWVDEGNVHYTAKRYRGAYEAYKQAAKRDPKMVAAQIGKGNALMGLEYYQSAIKAYERAIHLKSKSIEAHNGKGRGLRR